MRHVFLLTLVLLLLVGCAAPKPQVLLRTEMGDIRVEVYPRQAPVTASNFLEYVDQGLWEGAVFYRVVRMDNQPVNPVKIEVIQGGLFENAGSQALPAIEHETTERTGLKHVDGAFSMARLEPGTAGSEFFICVGNQPELDFGGRRNPDGQGFAVFGTVIEGMDVVRSIQQMDTDGQMLKRPVEILSISKEK